MRNFIQIAAFVVSRMPAPLRITAGIWAAPIARKTTAAANTIVKTAYKATKYVALPLIKSTSRLLGAPRVQQALPPARQGLLSHPLADLDVKSFLKPEWIVNAVMVVGLLHIAYGALRGRNTTFTPSKMFVKWVRRFVNQPWDLILILFQTGASTVIRFGICAIVVKYIKEFSGKSLLPIQKEQKTLSDPDNPNSGNKGGQKNHK